MALLLCVNAALCQCDKTSVNNNLVEPFLSRIKSGRKCFKNISLALDALGAPMRKMCKIEINDEQKLTEKLTFG